MYKFKPMNNEEAFEIAYNWKYPGIYKFYNITNDQEGLKEILDPYTRQEYNYYSCYYEEELFGYINYGISDTYREAEIGLAMNPSFRGKGQGRSFMEAFLSFLEDKYPIDRYYLYVADFNIPAIKLYKNLNFQTTRTVDIFINGKKYNFYEMILNK